MPTHSGMRLTSRELACEGASERSNPHTRRRARPRPRSTVTVQLACEEHALIAKQVLEVDPELQPSKAAREFDVHGAALTVTLRATELRVLRVVVASVYDMVGVVVRTLREFG